MELIVFNILAPFSHKPFGRILYFFRKIVEFIEEKVTKLPSFGRYSKSGEFDPLQCVGNVGNIKNCLISDYSFVNCWIWIKWVSFFVEKSKRFLCNIFIILCMFSLALPLLHMYLDDKYIIFQDLGRWLGFLLHMLAKTSCPPFLETLFFVLKM